MATTKLPSYGRKKFGNTAPDRKKPNFPWPDGPPTKPDSSYIGPDGRRHFPKETSPVRPWPPGPNEGDHSSSQEEFEHWWQDKQSGFSSKEAAASQFYAEHKEHNYDKFKAEYEGSWPDGDQPVDKTSKEYARWKKDYLAGTSKHDDKEVVTKYWDEKTQEYRFTTKSENLPMSNKFLPFVVENSTPLHIFKTLMSRSKGMNQVLIASTFNLVLTKDIKELRALVKEMPDMALEKVYEELVIKLPAFRVKDEVLATYQSVANYFPDIGEQPLWVDELKGYNINDIMLFFCSMAYAEKSIEDYTNYPYTLIMDSGTIDPIMENFQDHVQFADTGTDIKFDNAIELRCFIIYHGLFAKLMQPEYEAGPFNASLEYVA